MDSSNRYLTTVDTQILIWLLDTKLRKRHIRKTAHEALETSKVLVSPMVLLEIDYLREINRINLNHHQVLKILQQEIDIEIDPTPFYEITKTTPSITWTRDPFDRMIVAHSVYHQIPLITYDEKIIDHHDMVTN